MALELDLELLLVVVLVVVAVAEGRLAATGTDTDAGAEAEAEAEDEAKATSEPSPVWRNSPSQATHSSLPGSLGELIRGVPAQPAPSHVAPSSVQPMSIFSPSFLLTASRALFLLSYSRFISSRLVGTSTPSSSSSSTYSFSSSSASANCGAGEASKRTGKSHPGQCIVPCLLISGELHIGHAVASIFHPESSSLLVRSIVALAAAAEGGGMLGSRSALSRVPRAVQTD